MRASCSLAVQGWPMFDLDGQRIEPCVGFIESDSDPGTFYPCVGCNPKWERVTPEAMRTLVALPHGDPR